MWSDPHFVEKTRRGVRDDIQLPWFMLNRKIVRLIALVSILDVSCIEYK